MRVLITLPKVGILYSFAQSSSTYQFSRHKFPFFVKMDQSNFPSYVCVTKVSVFMLCCFNEAVRFVYIWLYDR